MNGSLLGVASTNFAYFYWYTIVRTLYNKSAKSTAAPSTAVELALGAVAGAVAQLFTIPVAVVTTRQQTASKDERKGLLSTANEVIHGPDGAKLSKRHGAQSVVEFRDQGYLPEALRARSAGSVWAQVNPIGAGNVVLFADDPAHRKYWLGTERLLINALFLSNHLSSPSRR